MRSAYEQPVRRCEVKLVRLSLNGAVKVGAVLGVTLMAAAFVAPAANAQSISGHWRGGGVVVFSDGHRERARCTAHYTPSGRGYSLEGTCATDAGSADQTAVLRQTGTNTYSGAFENQTFGIRGSIHVTVNGNTQSVSLRGGGGYASLNMRR
jgi:hypothetical protein